MLFEHAGRQPQVDRSAWIAPNAAVCGDVTIGPGVRIQYGAQVIAESGAIVLGRSTIVMENAVLRSSQAHPLNIGAACLVGPGAHVVGATVEDEVFIATGAAIFHGAYLERGSEVRIHGIVHLKSRLPAKAVVPIGWVAIGDPARIMPTPEHDAIWAILKPLHFVGTVYGVERGEGVMVRITDGLSQRLAAHASDRALD